MLRRGLFITSIALVAVAVAASTMSDLIAVTRADDGDNESSDPSTMATTTTTTTTSPPTTRANSTPSPMASSGPASVKMHWISETGASGEPRQQHSERLQKEPQRGQSEEQRQQQRHHSHDQQQQPRHRKPHRRPSTSAHVVDAAEGEPEDEAESDDRAEDEEEAESEAVLAADNCTAINAMADDFPNEAQNEIRRDRGQNRLQPDGEGRDGDENENGNRSENDLWPWNSNPPTWSASTGAAQSRPRPRPRLDEVPTTTSASSSSSVSSSSLAWVSSATPSLSSSTNSGSNSSSSPSTSSSPSSPTSPGSPPRARILSRPRRYLAFPEGSSFSVAVCITVGILGNPRYNFMSFGLNWGVAYDLPNTSWILNHLHGFEKRPKPVAVLRRRTRRSLYGELERVVDNMGYDGRACVLRTLCESRRFFARSKLGMVGEMLRVVFSLPRQRPLSRELREDAAIGHYDHAFRAADTDTDACSERFGCPFSLLELALGRYSTPPPGYFDPQPPPPPPSPASGAA